MQEQEFMTKEQFAAMLNGREYGSEITRDEAKTAKENGLVVVYGYSDDNCEFEGAIDEEIPCLEGRVITFNKDGSNFTDDNGKIFLTYHQKKSTPEPNKIEAVFSPSDPDCTWIYKTDIPHATFNIYEDGELFCVGIVFSINDLKD